MHARVLPLANLILWKSLKVPTALLLSLRLVISLYPIRHKSNSNRNHHPSFSHLTTRLWLRYVCVWVWERDRQRFGVHEACVLCHWPLTLAVSQSCSWPEFEAGSVTGAQVMTFPFNVAVRITNMDSCNKILTLKSLCLCLVDVAQYFI